MFCWGGNCVKYFFNSHETSMTVFFFFFFFFLGGGGGWGVGMGVHPIVFHQPERDSRLMTQR